MNPEGTDEQGGGGLRVNPAYIEPGQVVTSSGQRRATHSTSNNSAQRRQQYLRDRDRRHTLATHTTAARPSCSPRPSTNEEKRELFLEYLKQKYPEHSSTIDMAKSPDKDSLSFSNGFYDDDGTMSEIDTQATGFQRGGKIRVSLPITKTPLNKSKEKPLGLVYLNYMSETKRALMPNEVTGMDTVRALFVRAFPGKLTMEMLDSPQRKIYIQDPATDIFYELEKLDEVKDRVVLKIYEPGHVEDNSLGIRNSMSTPVDLNVCTDTELADIELPDFRERNYRTVGSKPIGTSRDQFDPHMNRPNSTTPMEMGNRRMHPQQGRGSTGMPSSPPTNEAFQRGTLERSTAPVRTSQGAPFPRGSPQRLSSTTLPRQQDGRRTPTNMPPRSMTMPRPMEKGQVYRPHPQQGGRPVEHRVQATVHSPSMASGQSPDNHRDDRYHTEFHPPRASTPHQHPGPSRGGPMASPRGPPQHQSPDPRDRPPPRERSMGSPRRQPPPQLGSPVKAPRGEMRAESPAYPRQPPHPDMQGRPPSRNNGQGMRQPPPNQLHHPGPSRPRDRSMDRPHDRPHDRSMDRPRDRSMERPRDRSMERPRDRPMDRPHSTPPHRVDPRGHGPPPMKHPHPPNANIREVESRMVRQGQVSSGAVPETEATDRISAMEQQIASLAGMVRSALKPGEQPPRGPQTPQPQVAPQQRIHSGHRATPVQTPTRSRSELTGLSEEVIRASQNQRAFTSVDGFHDGSDSQSVTPQPMSTVNARELRETKQTVRDLRDQLKQIRKLHLNMVQDMNTVFRATNRKVQLALEATPAGNEHPIRSLRTRTHQDYTKYRISRDKLDKEIRDLESAVEEMRDDVVNRHCHVNLAEVDSLAQAIGSSSKHIAEQKVAFPVLADKMKAVMQGEMEIVVTEENFIKEEPLKLDDYMKRCKKVTATLCTLKRLAAVQEHRTPVVPVFEQISEPVNREALLETIQSISPNHEERVKNLRAANETRERRHPLNSAQELHRFQMDLGKGRQSLKKTVNLDRINQRRRATLKELYQSEEHDTLTPILTPEKIAKQTASTNMASTNKTPTTATPGKKKMPPPPPPKRTYTSQQAVASHSPTSPSTVSMPGANRMTPNPRVIVTDASKSDPVPAVPPKPAMMVPKHTHQKVDDSGSARSAPDLSCMNYSSCSVKSECQSSPVHKAPLKASCTLSHSSCKSEPLLAISENEETSMINSQAETFTTQESCAARRQNTAPAPGTVMTSQSTPMRSTGDQSVPLGVTISPGGAASPRGVVTPEGGVMLSQGAVMIAKSGSATSPGLATTPQRQVPVRLLSSSSQGSPTKTLSPTSPQYKQSSIPILKNSPHSRPGVQSQHIGLKVVETSNVSVASAKSQTLPNNFSSDLSLKRRSSLPSSINIEPPPKPPRGCIETPAELIDTPPRSAFRPFAIPGWRETSLDDIPPKKRSVDKQRRHTVALPQYHKRNGWTSPVTENSPNTPLSSQTQILLAQQKSSPSKSIVTTETKVTTVKRVILSKSHPDFQSDQDVNSSMQKQNQDLGACPEVPVVDIKGALKIQQLKDQYAKLRKLQEEQKKLDVAQAKEDTVTQENPAKQNANEGASTHLPAEAQPLTTEHDDQKITRTEDQDEGSSSVKQTVVYRIGPKPYKTEDQKSNPSSPDEKSAAAVTAKGELIADSIPVTNGMVQQPVFSQLKMHEMAPRNFATKAKTGVSQMQPKITVNGNGTTDIKPSLKSTETDKLTDTEPHVPEKDTPVTNGDRKLPLTNGGSENVEGQGERVIERTEKEIKMFNDVNLNHSEKPQLKTVYTKRLEETFIY